MGKRIVEFLQEREVNFKTSVVEKEVKKQEERIARLISGGKENVYKVREAMQDVLMDYVGIFRNGKDLQTAVDKLQEILERAKNVGLKSSGKGANPELTLALKIEGMVKLALCVAYGALERKESRGSHAREDYPYRNDRDWWVRTLAYFEEGKSLPTLKYEPATKEVILPPGERGYGGAKIVPFDYPKDKPLPFEEEK